MAYQCHRRRSRVAEQSSIAAASTPLKKSLVSECGAVLIEVLLAFAIVAAALVALFQIGQRETDAAQRAVLSAHIETLVRNRLALLDAGVAEGSVRLDAPMIGGLKLTERVEQVTDARLGQALFKVHLTVSSPLARGTKEHVFETLLLRRATRIGALTPSVP